MQVHIRLAQPEPPSAPELEYVYRWDRIIAALSALFLLIGLLGYGLYSWLRPPVLPESVELDELQRQDEILVGVPQQSEGAEKEPTAAQQQVGTDVAVPKTAVAGTLSNSARSTARSEPLSENPAQQFARVATEIDPHRIAEATVPAKVTEQPYVQTNAVEKISEPTQMRLPVLEDVAEPATAQTPVLEVGDADDRATGQEPLSEARPETSATDAPDTLAAVRAETVSETAADESLGVSPISGEESDDVRFRPGNTSISSPAVKRFLLAQSVIANEPNGSIGNITMNANGFASVSSFSEVIGLEGETLQYRWLHEGKEVLRIRVPVRARRWRSHSTKRIYKKMKGAWRTELRDSAGTLLASTDFVF